MFAPSICLLSWLPDSWVPPFHSPRPALPSIKAHIRDHVHGWNLGRLHKRSLHLASIYILQPQ